MYAAAQTTPAPRPPAVAARRYRDDALEHRVAAATPHQLVTMLYDAAIAAAGAAEAATRRGDARGRLHQVTRVLAILDGLDTSLDHGRGGAVARTLSTAYGQIRALVVAANSEASADLFAATAERVASIAASWGAIGQSRAR